MSSITVRLDQASRETLKELAARSGETMQEVLRRAVEEYRRRVFLESVNAAYSKLRTDPAAWADVGREREDWDAASNDGLDRHRPRRAGGKRK
ncbi:MAG TPA: ribbon-helix-helix protein, CopG family [bacterium]|nr:ribbon-helix-helix protein, CopG family [bacterium]